MTFGQWINKSDTQEETADPSIASEDAVAQGDNDDNDNDNDNGNDNDNDNDNDENSDIHNGRRINFNTIDSQKEEGGVHEKLSNKPKDQRVSAVDRIKNNRRLILIVGLLMLLVVFIAVFSTIKTVKNEDSAIPGDEEDQFDFSDIDETVNPTISVFRRPSTSPSTSSFDFESLSRIPSSAPSVHEQTISYSPTGVSSNSPSLAPSTTPPTGSNAPTDLPSSSPTYFPTKSISPVARPPIVPFSDEDLDSVLTFCVIADAPYTQKELDELPGQIATQMEGCEFLVHLGDIFVGDTPCDIKDYETMQNLMLASHAPGFLVPGDNEWNDCTRSNIDIGWNHWTNHFVGFENNWNHTFSVVRQPGYEENFYFVEKRTLVIGLNIVAGRVHDKNEWKTRLNAEYFWVRDIMLLNLIGMESADGVILMAHAHPDKDHVDFFHKFRNFLRDELKNEFPILYLHGDGHDFMYTPYFHSQPNFLRIQHEGGTNEPVLKIIAGPGRGSNGRSSVYDAFQYDRQLELLKTNRKKD